MDIRIIEDAIEELEMEETTVENVQKLSSLYICRDYIKGTNLTVSNSFKDDVNEILPAYSKYCQAKRSYQMNGGSEEVVFESLSILCSEIKDLYTALHTSSNSRKERKILKNCVESIISMYQNC